MMNRDPESLSAVLFCLLAASALLVGLKTGRLFKSRRQRRGPRDAAYSPGVVAAVLVMVGAFVLLALLFLFVLPPLSI